MSIPGDPKPEGLRARKRRATENAIELSAVRLALEHGVEKVTVEAICEMADISRSTFFNYFPARDYAIVGRAIDVPDAAEAFVILDTSPNNVALGLFRLLFAAIGHQHVNAEVARLRGQLMAQQPEAFGLSITSLLENAFHLTAVGAAWLTAHPEHAKLDDPMREATLATSLVHGMVASNMAVWAMGEGDTTAEEADFERALDDYRSLLSCK